MRTSDTLNKIFLIKLFLCYRKVSVKPLPYVTTAVFYPVFVSESSFRSLPENDKWMTTLQEQNNNNKGEENHKNAIPPPSWRCSICESHWELSVLRAFCLNGGCQIALPEERPRTPQFLFLETNPACLSTQPVANTGQGQGKQALCLQQCPPPWHCFSNSAQ